MSSTNKSMNSPCINAEDNIIEKKNLNTFWMVKEGGVRLFLEPLP